jgi:predicted Zn-dependent peptidase
MAFQFRQHTLSNGLTIIAEVDPKAHTAAAGFYVKTGARDERPELMGVSHFLEHMMFKGTHDLTADELNRGFDGLGARNNAFTSNEMTCFFAHVLPEYTGQCLDLLGRMMRPALRQADFDTEKGVILEEIAMYADQPFWMLYEHAVEKHFGDSALSHRVLGTVKTITDLQRDAMQSYFDARYSADNTLLALAGNIDFEKVCDQAEKLCGNWQRTRVSRSNTKPRYAGGEFSISNEKVTRGYLLGLADAPATSDPRRYAASMLSYILGGSDNSRLHWALIEPGHAEEASASYDPHDGFGEYYLYASCDPARVDQVWSIIREQLRLLPDSITQDDLDRLLVKTVTAATLGGERPADRMHRLGRLWTYLAEYMPLEEELDRMSKVTVADLKRVAAEFPVEPITYGRLMPAGNAQ